MKKYHKVKDHCHYIWEYRDNEHNICNLKYSAPNSTYTLS